MSTTEQFVILVAVGNDRYRMVPVSASGLVADTLVGGIGSYIAKQTPSGGAITPEVGNIAIQGGLVVSTSTTPHGIADGDAYFNGVYVDGEVSIGRTVDSSFRSRGGLRLVGKVPSSYPFAATYQHCVIEVDTTAAARTVNLDVLGGGTVLDRVHIIIDAYGNAAANPITINPNGTNTIAGAASATISTNYGVLRLKSPSVAGNTSWLVW